MDPTSTGTTPTQRVLVSYSSSQFFLSSGSWKQVRTALTSQLPLRNIHWKSASRPSIRTIQELDITLVPLETRDEYQSQVPATILEKPLLNLYILSCEDNELEAYKNTIKKQIKDWHTVVSARKNQEWLILHIVRPDGRAQSGNFFHMKGTVSEKLKADFNTDKRDRCVQVPWSTISESPAVWAESINRIKDGILSAFDSSVTQREEDVKRSESQRQMPGWNFCTFFILKESLPNSFQGVNLFADALLRYEELEESFHSVLREKNLSWFGSLINPAPRDDSSPLLLVSKKPYRDLILANTISVFDFRIYLLARQCELLAKVGRLAEATSKVVSFLGAFGRRLREIEDTLPTLFIESWIYSSALSAIDQCDQWASHVSLDAASSAAFCAGKAELLELARSQLDIIGIRAGHLPAHMPFSAPLHSEEDVASLAEKPSELKITNQEILASIENREAFYELYVKRTNRAIDLYAKSGRRKFALKLHGSLAALDVHRGRLTTALTTFTSLPAHYAPHMWTSLESLMLSRALDTHESLDKPKDTEWIHILLSFLKTFVERQGTDLLSHGQDKVDYISRLVISLKSAATVLESDIAHPDHPALSVRVSGEASLREDEDGSFLSATVFNALPCNLPVDEVSVVLVGRESERLRFSAPITELSPGKTEVVLSCPTSGAGLFLLESSELRISRLLLQYSYRKGSSTGKSTKRKKDIPSLVRIPRDFLAVEIELFQPDCVELGKPLSVIVALSSGRNHISSCTIKLASVGIAFNFDKARLLEPACVDLKTTEDSLTLGDIPENMTTSISIPHTDASASQVIKVNVEAEYTTTQSTTVRHLRVTRNVPVSLPISVNVEDFFRGTRLFSKFTISTTSERNIRILGASLGPPEGWEADIKIQSTETRHRKVATVTPTQPTNFLFAIQSPGGPVPDSLSLRIQYRMLQEEVESLIKSVVDDSFRDLSPLFHRTLLSQLVEAVRRDSSWVELYGLAGGLHVPDISAEGEMGTLLDQTKQLLREHTRDSASIGRWREIIIPVDVPYMNIIAAARLRILSTPSTTADSTQEEPSLYAGQPISAELSIHTSFHWGSSAHDKSRRYRMRFDIDDMVRDWLISGSKRGDFSAKDDGTYTAPITLIALHHGELSLPRISVRALPVGEVTMGSMAVPSAETYQVHGAERVLVLPRGGRSTFVVNMGPG